MNTYGPQFVQTEFEFHIPRDKDGFIGNITAVDKDRLACADDKRDPCDCPAIQYSIRSGNELGLFRIDTKTGSLFVKGENHVIKERAKLQIEANDGKATMVDVKIYYEGEAFLWDERALCDIEACPILLF